MSNGRLLAAEALIHAGNPLGAQSMLEELLKDDPENVRGRILYGLTFVDSEPQRALDMLQGALSDAPEMPVAHRSLGFAQLGCNKLDDAGESFTKANELSPEDPDTKMALATLASRKRTPAVAEFWIKKALNLRPENVASYALWALVCIDDKRVAEAQGYAERALRLDPHHPSANLAAAWVGVKQGEMDTARTHLDAAAHVNPNHPGVAMLILFMSYGARRWTGWFWRGGLGLLPEGQKPLWLSIFYPLSVMWLLGCLFQSAAHDRSELLAVAFIPQACLFALILLSRHSPKWVMRQQKPGVSLDENF